MKSLNEAEFLEWATGKGLHLDPRYPKSAVLTFRDAPGEARFWKVPFEPHRRPYFILSLLKLLGNWRVCYVWRHMGSWPREVDPLRVNDVVELEIFKGLGLPLGTADVVEFSRDDIKRLVTLMFSTTVFGWSVGQDLYVVPDHAQALLQTDHHEVIHAVCRDPANIQQWIEGMEHAGFALPDGVPDSTFKTPVWMTRSDG